MRRMLLLAMGFLLTAVAALAQRTVRGSITNEQGAPVQGATITVKGTKIVIAADDRGGFSITLPPKTSTLVFSAVGFTERELVVGNEQVLKVKLNTAIGLMSDVVVIAYGTSKKEAISGSVSSVSAKDIEKRPLSNGVSALEGAAAGVQVNATLGQPGSEPQIRIRGAVSPNGNNDPLYVIDGVPVGGKVYESNSAAYGVHPLNDINPADIESISVLKDASSTALYGNRASAGVIIITTKRGSKGASSVNFVMNQGVYGKGINEYERMNTTQFMETMWKGYRNSLMTSSSSTYPTYALAGAEATKSLVSNYLKLNIYNKADDALFDENGKLVSDAQILPGYADDLDWAKAYERTGRRQDYSLSGRTGSEKNSMFFSVGYLDEKGYVNNADFKRFIGRINADLQVNDWFKYGFNVGASHQVGNNAAAITSTSSTSLVNPVYAARNMAPIYPVHLHDVTTGEYLLDASGNKQYDDGSTTRNQMAGRNAIQENELNKDRTIKNAVNGQVFTSIKFLKDFTFSFNGDMNLRNSDRNTYDNAEIGDGAGTGRASRYNYQSYTYTLRQSLEWNKKFRKEHSLNVMAGHENYNDEYNYLSGSKSGETFANQVELGNFSSITSLDGYKMNTRTEGYYGRARYSFRDKYFVDGSFRRDGSSRFAPGKKWGNFWSLGGSWSISKEDFFQSLADKVNYLKLRASYGVVGNDASAKAYAWMALYNMNQNANAAALYKSQNAALDLEWEQSASTVAAIEGRVFDRVNFVIEYFNKAANNLIYDVNLPLSAGATQTSTAEAILTKNVGKLYNRGWEFTVDVDVLKTKDFRFNVATNATVMKNRITQLAPENKGGIIDGSKRLLEGHSMYEFWLYQFVGVDQMTGNALYLLDTDTYGKDGTGGSTSITSWLTTINGTTYTTNTTYAKKDWSGGAMPNVYGSFTPGFSYKNLNLSALFTYSIGGKVYDNVYASLRSMSGTPAAMHTDLLKAWDGVPAGITETSANRIDPNGVPAVNFARSTYNNSSYSSMFLVDASYLVFKNINLNYRFSPELLKKIEVKSATVGITVDNVFTSTKLKGMNPQQNFTGLNYNMLATPRVFSVVLNVGL